MWIEGLERRRLLSGLTLAGTESADVVELRLLPQGTQLRVEWTLNGTPGLQTLAVPAGSLPLITVDLRGGGDTLVVRGRAAQVVALGGAGDDTVRLVPDGTASPNGQLALVGGLGNDTVVVEGAGVAATQNYRVVLEPGVAFDMEYTNANHVLRGEVEQLRIDTGAAADSVRLDRVRTPTRVEVRTGGGDDSLWLMPLDRNLSASLSGLDLAVADGGTGNDSFGFADEGAFVSRTITRSAAGWRFQYDEPTLPDVDLSWLVSSFETQEGGGSFPIEPGARNTWRVTGTPPDTLTRIQARGGADTYLFTGGRPDAQFEVLGGGGADTLRIESTGDTTIGEGRLRNASLGQIAFVSVAKLELKLTGTAKVGARPQLFTDVDLAVDAGSQLTLGLAGLDPPTLSGSAGSGSTHVPGRRAISYGGFSQLQIDDVAPTALPGPMFDVDAMALRPRTSEPVGLLPRVEWTNLMNRQTGLFVRPVAGSISADSGGYSLSLPRDLPDADYRIGLPAGSFSDAAGNPSAGEIDQSFHVLSGDFDRNRSVDFADLVILARNYNRPGAYTQGDADRSGRVDFADLVILARNYGRALPTPLFRPAVGGRVTGLLQ